MRPWQFLALVSGAIVAVVIAFASVSYNATLGTTEPAFAWAPMVTNTNLFAVLALAFDLGMVASVFGFLHWRHTNRTGAALCVALFLIASLFSIHSVRGYIALNLTRSLAGASRAADVYRSLKLELAQDQDHVERLRQRLVAADRRERKHLDQELDQLAGRIAATRSRLARTDSGHHVSPLAGLEWFLAVTLWFFNASCWSAWFGTGESSRRGAPIPTPSTSASTSSSSISSTSSANIFSALGDGDAGRSMPDSVALFLAACPLRTPEHCASIYARYRQWAREQGADVLPERKFYARLVAMGARKFRDGRNGPMKYMLDPPTRTVN